MPAHRDQIASQFLPFAIAGFLLLSLAASYIYWIKRSRPVMPARSLTAANHPVTPATATRTLHIEGCHDDFVARVGELVEPLVVPGAPISQFRDIYGPETRLPHTHQPASAATMTWKTDPFNLTEASPAGQPSYVRVDLNQGHVVQTLDGIELGIDSFNAILHKLRDRQIEVHQRIAHEPNGDWTLIVSFYSNCSHKYRSQYTRTLPADPETDRLISPSPTQPSPAQSNPSPTAPPQPAPSTLLRSDIFLNKIATGYTMALANGHDDTTEGQPAEHQ